MPFLGVVVLLNAVNWMGMIPAETITRIYLVTGLTTCIVPWLFMPVFKATKLISDYLMPETEERKIPLLFASFMHLIAAFLLQKINAPMTFPLFVNSVSVVILICALVSWKWKISYHMAAVAGLVGLILGISMKWMMDFRLIFAAAVLASGIIAWARLRDKEHTPAQVYAGFGLGFVVVFCIVRVI